MWFLPRPAASCLSRFVSSRRSRDGGVHGTVRVDAAATALGRAVTPCLRNIRKDGHPSAHRCEHEAFAARMLWPPRPNDAGRPVLHLARRHDGHPAVRISPCRAGRGVRVRLLLDDNNTQGSTTPWRTDSHPNIEVRLFNPFRIRKPRVLGYLADFSRMNRRMHNKSFTADNGPRSSAAATWAMNISGPPGGPSSPTWTSWPGAGRRGSVGRFDRYWASASAHPATGSGPRRFPPSRSAGVGGVAHRRPSGRRGVYERIAPFRVRPDLLRAIWTWNGRDAHGQRDPGKGLGRAAPEIF